MSLPRKDVRFYLDPHMHAALVAICDARGIDLNDQVEQVITHWVEAKVHEASLIASATAGLGISRINPELPGLSRKADR